VLAQINLQGKKPEQVQDHPAVRGTRTTRIADDDNDGDNADAADEPFDSESEVSDGNAPPTEVGHGYRNVTDRDSVPPLSNLKLGQKITPIQFFVLLFTYTGEKYS
jgi:hypothetical protein